MLSPEFISGEKSSISRHYGQELLSVTSQANLYYRGMELKDWVRAARAHKGWTLAAFGVEMSRSKATIGFWENGETKPSYEQMKKISELTGYPLPDPIAAQSANAIQAARQKKWPFDQVDYERLVSLKGEAARGMQAAMLSAAAALGINIAADGPANRKQA